MSDEFTLTVPLAKELHDAFRRNGYTAADVKELTKGDKLRPVLLFLKGHARFVADLALSFVRYWQAPSLPGYVTPKKFWENARVKWMGDNFKVQFLDLEIAPSAVETLSVYRPKRSTYHPIILDQLGGRAETTVSQFYSFLAEKTNSETREDFFFYLRGREGDLWAVRAMWSPGHNGWTVEAYPPQGLFEFNEDLRVVSRM